MTKLNDIYDRKLFERRNKIKSLLEKRSHRALNKAYHVGVDPNTSRIVFATELTSTANSMSDIGFRTSINYSVNYTFANVHKFDIDIGRTFESVPIADKDFDLTRCWEWGYQNGMIIHKGDNLDADLVARYKLILTMCLAIDYVHKKVRFVHRSVVKDLPLQQTIYLLKKEQAEKVIAGVTDPIVVPFVVQWSEIRNITLEQAAKEILFRHTDTMYRLIDAERMRLTYVNKIKSCKDVDNIYDTLESYDKENTLHAKV
jgi:hypothetical protein